MSLPAGAVIGPYEVVGWLGAGGMGEVYRARDARLDRDVAIKLVAGPSVPESSRVDRFTQEARAAGQLNHPNILVVYDIGTHDGLPYIVSELLDGESLRRRIEGGALATRKAVDYARQIAEGLAAAHDKGIVHRDLKPDNLFITTEGRVKILDFGLAKLTLAVEGPAKNPTEDTEVGAVLGTVGYMSPEQVRGEHVDPRSDLFSFGVIFHEMLTGHRAFTRATAADTMAAILKEEPSAALSGVAPQALERIVMRCLEKTREARFQSARDLAFGLEGLSDTPAPAARRPNPPRPSRQRPWAWLALGAILSVIALVLVAWTPWRGVTPPVPLRLSAQLGA
ncbi:MAG: serine/threonine protein kinase, partial [Acidobacteria bacterium]|nr:serine/threonine protein kinase [Acidobacteriota bacterium]